LHIWSQSGYHSGWIVLSHLPFTFAYAYLVLKGPFQSVESRYELLAASFGYSPWQSWWQVRFRLLLPAIFTAFAIAFSVSITIHITFYGIFCCGVVSPEISWKYGRARC
jgi:putative thiamine transport system permease protein